MVKNIFDVLFGCKLTYKIFLVAILTYSSKIGNVLAWKILANILQKRLRLWKLKYNTYLLDT